MHKIKGFKISLRPASVRKHFKALSGRDELTPEAEELLRREYEATSRWLVPAAVFDTLRSGRWPEFAMDPTESSETPAAITLFAVTVGGGVEEEIARLGSPDHPRALALAALAQEGTEAAAGFIARLVDEEAKQEDCTPGDPSDFMRPEPIQAALNHLQADRIGVSWRPSPAALSPRFTRLCRILWIPRMTKKRRLLLTPESAPPADRPA